MIFGKLYIRFSLFCSSKFCVLHWCMSENNQTIKDCCKASPVPVTIYYCHISIRIIFHCQSPVIFYSLSLRLFSPVHSSSITHTLPHRHYLSNLPLPIRSPQHPLYLLLSTPSLKYSISEKTTSARGVTGLLVRPNSPIHLTYSLTEKCNLSPTYCS